MLFVYDVVSNVYDVVYNVDDMYMICIWYRRIHHNNDDNNDATSTSIYSCTVSISNCRWMLFVYDVVSNVVSNVYDVYDVVSNVDDMYITNRRLVDETYPPQQRRQQRRQQFDFNS